MKKQVYKPYNQNQPMLIPLDLNEMIEEDHQVRKINEIINKIDTSALKRQYKGGGTSAYHPEMLLKGILYAYTQNIYSSRRIAKAMRENIHFMWLTGMNRPDFRTINRFRSVVMRAALEEIFTELVAEMLDMKLVDFREIFVDGTKIEANANKYSFVWKKSTEGYKEKLQKSVRIMFDEVEAIQEWEDEIYGEKDLNEVEGGKHVTSEDLQRLADKVTEKLNAIPENKELKKTKKKLS